MTHSQELDDLRERLAEIKRAVYAEACAYDHVTARLRTLWREQYELRKRVRELEAAP